MKRFMTLIAPILGLLTLVLATHITRQREEQAGITKKIEAARIARVVRQDGPLAVKIFSDGGAGTAWGYRGYLVTAAHVCQTSKKMDIVVEDHAEEAVVLYSDARADICVLSPTRIMPRMLEKGKELGDSDTVTQCGLPGFGLVLACQKLKRITQARSAIAPFSIGGAVQAIFVHAYRMIEGISKPGMSGGPALNSKGQVIGLLTGGDGINFTLLASIADLDSIIDHLK